MIMLVSFYPIPVKSMIVSMFFEFYQFYLFTRLSKLDRDTIFFTFDIYSDSAVALVEDIPVGVWELHVDAFDVNENIIYIGSTSVTVKAGMITPVNLHMDPNTGGLSIIVTWGESEVDITEGLVAYYPFSGNANDESGNGNHGDLSGVTLVEDRNGNTNSAYSFGGDGDCIFIGNSDVLEISGELTICAWVYYDEFDSYSGILAKGLMYNGTEWQGAYGIGVNKDNQKIYFDIKTESVNRRSAISEDQLTLDEWYHITGTFTPGKGLKLYLNGILTGSNDFEDEMINHTTTWNNNDVRIGDSQQSQIDPYRFPGFFNGIIDEIRIYNRVLNQSEILEIISLG